jgi:hypothetical protein
MQKLPHGFSVVSAWAVVWVETLLHRFFSLGRPSSMYKSDYTA